MRATPLALPLVCLALCLVVSLPACSSDDKERSCPQGERLCAGTCVSTDSDDSNCGACGNACAADEVCLAGLCEPSACDEGLEACGRDCVDLQENPAHCGGCDRTCAPGELCFEAACLPSCEEGLSACEGTCVDLQTDTRHCGACGTSCVDAQLCVDAQCRCPGEQAECGGLCVDLGQDPQHCGDCNHACGENERCQGGSCACAVGYADCDGRCVDLATDPEHCGDCGSLCSAGPGAAGATCTAGACVSQCQGALLDCDGDPTNGCEVDGDDDRDNCGACDHRCEEYEVCLQGSCVSLCAPGLTACAGSCVQLSDNDSHCGRCDNACSDEERCVGGRCLCSDEFERCGDACVDTETDAAHCGGCGQPCEDNEVCSQGLCFPPCGENEQRCDGVCVSRDDPAHCGACGRDCEGGENVLSGTCSAGTCDLTCDAGWTDCDGDPANGCEADLQVDANNCGACGISCPGGCVAGECSEAGGYAGWDSTCALLSDGGVKCWGDNHHGQLGIDDANVETTAVPTSVRDPDDPAGEVLQGAKRVTVSYIGIHACALLAPKGEVVCWGRNTPGGRLGDGTTTNRLHPVWVLEEAPQGGNRRLQGATELCIGHAHSCARMEDGTMRCWGRNTDGQLGTGSASSGSTVAVPVVDGAAALGGVEQIACGPYGTCAVLQGGTLACWGQNDDGQLGRSGDGSASPERLPLPHVRQVSVGDGFVCAILGDESVACWGKNNWGQLGDGSTQPSVTPVAVQGVFGARRISTGGNHSCALLADGTARCWGFNAGGKLGDGSNGGSGPVAVADPAQPLPGLPGAYQPLDELIGISAGETHTCATRRDGAILCWGGNGKGQLGDGTTTTRFLPGPVQW